MAKREHRLRVNSFVRLHLPPTATALAMVMALSTPSHAQQADTQTQNKPQGQQQSGAPERKEIDKSSSLLQEVVVTGIRKSLESAQAIKQDADQVVDSVTAQDIGALPDRSVSEALQRIPGVTLSRTATNFISSVMTPRRA